MILLVGLGNPGAVHATHRHNVGFMAVDTIRQHHIFGNERDRFQGLVSEGRLGSHKALVLKPTTWMNLSGQSVAAAARFYRIEPGNIVVFHDEIALAPSRIRIKKGGGAAGHNGIKSVIAHIGADFRRVRIGVGHPGTREQVNAHVLSNFNKVETEWLTPLLDAMSEAAPLLAEEGRDDAFASRIHSILSPNHGNTPRQQTRE
ncbi:MAG: aminoacyl-tRNA hydrolase [Parvularculales bacterium]